MKSYELYRQARKCKDYNHISVESRKVQKRGVLKGNVRQGKLFIVHRVVSNGKAKHRNVLCRKARQGIFS